MRSSYAVFVLSLLIQACHPLLAAPGFEWKILKTSWSSQDEKNYRAFIERIGTAVEKKECGSVTQCFNSAANTYRKSDPPGLNYRADCADFPYFTRAYFAWKNGLPFSAATEMKLRNVSGNYGDLRYSAFGNEVAKKMDVAARSGFPDAKEILNRILPDETDSGNFRVNYSGNDQGSLATDFYPLKLDRESLQPGTILYDPNGHVTIIYRITDDGKLYYVDAHPDNSLTTGAFSIKFVRANPGQGAGFKYWRPVQLQGAKLSPRGEWLGGQIVSTPNRSIANYGTEQFFGTEGTSTDWTQSKFRYQDKSVTYYEYVRLKLAKGDLRINPLDDFRSTLSDLCQSLQDRVNAVDVAIKAGISTKEHPDRLPVNIYGTQGEWETYSTPSRDAQLKVSFRDLLDQSADYMKKLKAGDPTLVYSGPDLAGDLLRVYRNESQSCQISYVNSIGRSIYLNLDEIRQRLFKLSFDPYHCVELRWGASNQEASTCGDGSEKRLWYAREQRLRNQHIRRYDIRMDFTLEDLAKDLPNNGVAEPIDVDIVRFLENLN